MDYLDFEVEITPGSEGGYIVAVIRSPAGEAREKVRWPYSQLQLENRLKDLKIALLSARGRRRRALSPEEQAVQDFGRELFDLLLPREIRGLYRVSLSRATAQARGLRLKLRLKETPELAALPWEFLYDPNKDEYLCLSRDTPLVRYLELPRPPAPLKVAAPLRILGMIASPANLPKLDVSREKERVERALADLQAAGLVELTWLAGQTWRHLHKAMRRQEWHIFHFIGHGGFDRRKDEGFVSLCDGSGRERPFMASELARLLANQRSSLRLALLNACEGGHGSQQDIFSSVASILVRQGMPAVLAMQYEISDRAAIELARSFYEALADGLPVDAAVTEARQAMGFAAPGSIEWVTPVLYMRSPDGKLFDVQVGGTPPKPRTESVQEPTQKPAGKQPEVKPPAPKKSTRTPPPSADRFVHEKTGLEFVRVPAGKFFYGDEKERIHLPEYWISKTPVTHAVYRRFIAANPEVEVPYVEANWAKPYNWNRKKRTYPSDKADHPVVLVNSRDAAAFCEWAGLQLPTEEQWEKAARGTDGREYPWGSDDPTDKLCNFNKNVGGTTPVGQYSPWGDSPYDCVDMSGNVWEWCPNKYLDLRRVVRGGSWSNDQNYACAASRYFSDPDARSNSIGFRVAGSRRSPSHQGH